MADSVRRIIEKDLYRYGVKSRFGLAAFVKWYWIKSVPGIRFSIIFRLCQHYRRRNRLLFGFFFLWLRRIKYQYGIDISHRTQIGAGLYIGHFGGIVVHGDAVIGENCNLSQGMTIGVLNRGRNAGIPKIGNRVFIGPGAIILGNIRIGDDALIGANVVVNFDVPDKGVAAAAKASVISTSGSSGYVSNFQDES